MKNDPVGNALQPTTNTWIAKSVIQKHLRRRVHIV